MKKRLASILVMLALMPVLLPGAEAAGLVMVSRQGLRVDGKAVSCRKYNIDDRNYFMLRDLALLLTDSGSRFSVDWDEEKGCVVIATGAAYTPNGSELDLSQGDQSDTAVSSRQPIYIDGALRTDLTAYNIGGHNYFQLRELGDALGFFVDYDKESNTAIILSRTFAEPTPWRVREERELGPEGFGERSEQYRRSTYDAGGRLLTEVSGFAANEYEWANSRTYDELGRPVKEVRGSRSRETGEPGMQTVTTWEYDRWGNLAKETVEEDGSTTEIVYTYDDAGNLIRKWEGDSGYTYAYDAAGRMIREAYELWDGTVLVKEYAYDEAGNLLLERELDQEGAERGSTAYTWEGGLCTRVFVTIGSYEAVTDYVYDEAGNLIRQEESYSDFNAVTTYAYDAAGHRVHEEWHCGEEWRVWDYAYDDSGNLLRETCTASADPADARRNAPYTAEYTYDEDGLLLHKLVVENGVDITETSVTYDREAGKMTVLIEHRAAPAEEG